ncbi:hypothetical protein CN067_34365 [Sinorhizobium meliloti]|uniref:hypothetical protein n=1 Tax=Rhizobium meliloti TaxID=382 RepID=UPI000FDC7A99|nr:hypothetical protein [Sinorhizobium meliloti]RVQ09711.1 hypothetical protein CN067_34365 [Sinorhizobium meliloti]
MAKKPEKPVYAFIRHGNSLRPEMQYDMQALDGIEQGQRVKLEIKQWRNLDRLKAYWATLQDCVDATGCAPSKEALDAYIRPAVNFVDTVRLANGFMVGIPRAINTRQCDEPEMIAFFNAATELLARDFGYVAPTPEERARAAA